MRRWRQPSPTSSTRSTSIRFAQLAAKTLALNEIGVCNLSVARPVAFDPYADNRETGAFILIDRYTNGRSPPA